MIKSAPFTNFLSPYSNRTIIHSKSIVGRRILGDSQLSPESAIALFLTIPSYPGRSSVQFPTPQGGFQIAPLVEGLIRADLLQQGFSATEQQGRLSDIATEGGNLIAAYKKEVSLAREQREEIQSKGSQLLDYQKTVIDEAARLFSDQRGKHDSELEKIRASFREEMKLRESRRYWAEKAVRHKRIGKNWFIAFGASAAATLVLLYFFANKVVEVAKAPSTSALPGAEWVLLVVPALIVLWVLRFFQRHATLNLGLMNDADERVTMVETYLALTSEGKIEAIERPLVLQALFRPNVTSAEDEVSVSVADHLINVLNKK
ncbi:MAG TPA: DUF6161 domain-containing protein [Candidatus Dormibacteraeota bacterium]|nr:DUF6161 domain-containing protein [Candidatus Dormibacteraeota bacterium]